MGDPTLRVRQTLDNSQFQKGLKQSQGAANSFAKQMKSLGGLMAGAFAVGSVVSFFKTSMEGLMAEEQAQAALLNSLRGRADVTNRLIDQAKELSLITLYEDDAIVNAQSMLAVFVKQEDQLKALMPLVLDFATKFKMDVASAANLVGKSLGSSTNALKRYGFEVEGAVGSADRFNSAMQALSGMSGAAEAAANTNAGAVQQLGKAWGEFGETLVGFIGPALTSVAKGLTQTTAAADTFLSNKNFTAWEKIKMVLAGMTGNTEWSAEVFANNYTPAAEEAVAVTEEITPIIEEDAEALEAQAKAAEDAANAIKKLQEQIAEGKLKAELELDIEVSKIGQEDREGLAGQIGDLETGQELDFSDVAIDTEQADAAIAEWERYTAAVEANSERIQGAMEAIGSAVGQALGEFIKGEAKFSDVAAGLLQSIIKIVAGYLTESVAASFAGGASAGGPAAPFTGAAAAAAALSMFGALVPALMAEGGTVPGGYPGDSYPALLTSGETVVPPHKLDMMRGGGQTVNVVGMIRGNDIHFINEKMTSKKARYGGR